MPKRTKRLHKRSKRRALRKGYQSTQNRYSKKLKRQKKKKSRLKRPSRLRSKKLSKRGLKQPKKNTSKRTSSATSRYKKNKSGFLPKRHKISKRKKRAKRKSDKGPDKRIGPRGLDRALSVVGETLDKFKNYFEPEFPDVHFSEPQVRQYADLSCSGFLELKPTIELGFGESVILNVKNRTREDDWKVLFSEMASFQEWPRGCWFSMTWEFTAPKKAWNPEANSLSIRWQGNYITNLGQREGK